MLDPSTHPATDRFGDSIRLRSVAKRGGGRRGSIAGQPRSACRAKGRHCSLISERAYG
jgi:hypothetical protein